MKNAVATIPVDPSHAGKFGFHSLFSFTNYIARLTRGKSVYAINTQGKTVDYDAIGLLKNNLETLKLQPDIWWNDEVVTSSMMQDILSKLFQAGIVRVENHELRRCVCGKIEYFANVRLFGRKSLIKHNLAECCHSTLHVAEERVLVMAPIQAVQLPNVFPKWAAAEFEAEFQKLIGSKLLISRIAKRKFTVQLDGESWNLDTDLLWWFFPVWLQQQNLVLQRLVTGHTTMRQAAIITSLTTLLGVPVPTHVYCLPKVHFETFGNVETVAKAVEKYGYQRIANALLWCSLSKRKDFELGGSSLPSFSDVECHAELFKIRSKLRR